MPILRMPADNTLADTLSTLGTSMAQAFSPKTRMEALMLRERLKMERFEYEKKIREEQARQLVMRRFNFLKPQDQDAIREMIYRGEPMEKVMALAARLGGAINDNDPLEKRLADARRMYPDAQLPAWGLIVGPKSFQDSIDMQGRLKEAEAESTKRGEGKAEQARREALILQYKEPPDQKTDPAGFDRVNQDNIRIAQELDPGKPINEFNIVPIGQHGRDALTAAEGGKAGAVTGAQETAKGAAENARIKALTDQYQVPPSQKADPAGFDRVNKANLAIYDQIHPKEQVNEYNIVPVGETGRQALQDAQTTKAGRVKQAETGGELGAKDTFASGLLGQMKDPDPNAPDGGAAQNETNLNLWRRANPGAPPPPQNVVPLGPGSQSLIVSRMATEKGAETRSVEEAKLLAAQASKSYWQSLQKDPPDPKVDAAGFEAQNQTNRFAQEQIAPGVKVDHDIVELGPNSRQKLIDVKAAEAGATAELTAAGQRKGNPDLTKPQVIPERPPASAVPRSVGPSERMQPSYDPNPAGAGLIYTPVNPSAQAESDKNNYAMLDAAIAKGNEAIDYKNRAEQIIQLADVVGNDGFWNQTRAVISKHLADIGITGVFSQGEAQAKLRNALVGMYNHVRTEEGVKFLAKPEIPIVQAGAGSETAPPSVLKHMFSNGIAVADRDIAKAALARRVRDSNDPNNPDHIGMSEYRQGSNELDLGVQGAAAKLRDKYDAPIIPEADRMPTVVGPVGPPAAAPVSPPAPAPAPAPAPVSPTPVSPQAPAGPPAGPSVSPGDRAALSPGPARPEPPGLFDLGRLYRDSSGASPELRPAPPAPARPAPTQAPPSMLDLGRLYDASSGASPEVRAAPAPATPSPSLLDLLSGLFGSSKEGPAATPAPERAPAIAAPPEKPRWGAEPWKYPLTMEDPARPGHLITIMPGQPGNMPPAATPIVPDRAEGGRN